MLTAATIAETTVMASLLLLLLLALLRISNVDGLLVGAWNVQVLGVSKMEKPHVVAELVRVLRRYDLVCVQEVRNADQTTVPI